MTSKASGIILTHFKPPLYYKLNERPVILGHLVQLITTSGISRVLGYSIRSSTEYSNRKNHHSHSPTREYRVGQLK